MSLCYPYSRVRESEPRPGAVAVINQRHLISFSGRFRSGNVSLSSLGLVGQSCHVSSPHGHPHVRQASFYHVHAMLITAFGNYFGALANWAKLQAVSLHRRLARPHTHYPTFQAPSANNHDGTHNLRKVSCFSHDPIGRGDSGHTMPHRFHSDGSTRPRTMQSLLGF
jgi:hypothetical protein